MPRDYQAVIAAPGFALGIRTNGDAIESVDFLPPETPPAPPADDAARRACAQIERYLAQPDAAFELPLAPQGTAFQRRVWDAIRRIPRGRTATYAELARELGTAPRAVGQACGANPYPLVVPCHRVVGSGGLGGFAHQRNGLLLQVKHWLLAHEGAR
jgi:methylated-DNA-[protein]-cysteine S-methyltransferase